LVAKDLLAAHRAAARRRDMPAAVEGRRRPGQSENLVAIKTHQQRSDP